MADFAASVIDGFPVREPDKTHTLIFGPPCFTAIDLDQAASLKESFTKQREWPAPPSWSMWCCLPVKKQLERGFSMSCRLLVVTALTLTIVAVAPAFAQPGPPGPGWGPGMMMGPGMMGGGGFGFFCNPRMAGFAEWRLREIEVAVKPNETQKAALDELKNASTKAAEIITKDCPSTIPAKPTERLELAERRLETMLQAIKSVRPAFQAFYDSLDDKQKANLDAVGPRSWGWHNWRWPWAAE